MARNAGMPRREARNDGNSWKLEDMVVHSDVRPNSPAFMAFAGQFAWASGCPAWLRFGAREDLTLPPKLRGARWTKLKRFSQRPLCANGRRHSARMDPERSWRLRSAPVFPSGLHSVKQPVTTGVKAGVAVVSTGAATSKRPVSVSRIIGERSDKRSVPEILKPSQKQPLYNSKDHRGRNTKHERSVRRLQRSQQSPRRCQKKVPVTQCRVVDR